MATPPVLATFDGADGEGPNGDIIFDANGDLFGATNGGGADGEGTVFEIVNTGTAAAPAYGSSPTTLVNFDNSASGEYPGGGVIADAKGDLFGATNGGGPGGDGTIYELVNTGTLAAPVYSGTPTILVRFDGSTGENPQSGLIADANADLFGVIDIAAGGMEVFEVVNTGTAAAAVYSATPTLISLNGAYADGGLIADANGDLFGTMSTNGPNGGDGVYEIVNTGTAAAPVYASAATGVVSLNRADGEIPYGSLALDAHGDLFGTTYTGGRHDDGSVFEVVNTGTVAAPAYASAATTLVVFTGTDGANPRGDLIVDANGDLFGTTAGTVFEVINTGTAAAPVYASTATTLASFDGTNDVTPVGHLVADANGDLFGSTRTGGAKGDGTVYELTNSGFQLVAIASAGGLTDDAVQTINGESTMADAGAAISIYDGSTLLGTTTVTSDGSWSLSANLTPTQGDHSLTAQETTTLGAVVSSAPVAYTLDTIAPTVAITSSGGLAAKASLTVSGTIAAAEAGLTVAIYSGSTLIGTTTAAADGTWSASVALLSLQGAQSVTAAATDEEGLTGTSAVVSYTLENQYVWKSVVAGSWNIAANWNNTTIGQNPADVVPGADDAVTITAPSAGATHVITGTGSSASLTIGGPTILAGQFTTGMLDLPESLNGAVTLNAGDSLTVTGDATIGQGGSLTDNGGSLSIGGVLTNSGATIGISNDTVTVGSDFDSDGALQLTDAQLAVAGNLSAHANLNVDDSSFTIDGALASSSKVSFTVTDGGSVQVQQGTLASANINLSLDANSSFEFGAIGGVASGVIRIDQGMSIAVGGAWSAPSIVDNGAITVNNALTLTGALTGDGEIDLADGAGLTLQSIAADSANTVSFEGDGVLTLSGAALNSPGTFAIANFDASDAIEFDGVATDATYADGVLTFDDNGTTVGEVNLNGDYGDDSFDAISLGNGITQISLGPAWTAPVDGSFTDASDWSTDSVPGANDSVAISASSPVSAALRFGSRATAAKDYTVSWTKAGTIRSLEESSTRATLAIADPGHVNRIVGDAIFRGALRLDAGAGEGGSTLKIGGALTNHGAITFGNAKLDRATTVSTGAISNAGAIHLIDGTTKGADIALTAASLDNWGEVDVAVRSATMDFGFDVRSSGRIVVQSGALTLSGPANVLSGSIRGAGGLGLIGGSTILKTGASVATARWSIRGASTRVTLDRDLNYGGTFALSGGAIFNATGGSLDLTGASVKLSGIFEGSHSLSTHHTTSVSTFTVGGTAIWRNFGTITQGATRLTLGDDRVGDAATLDNQAGATYDLRASGVIARGASTASRIDNAGLFEKTGGSGLSRIAPAVANSGTLKVSSGTLDLEGEVWAKGTDIISGASKLEFGSAVASGQTIGFSGLGGELILADPHAFASEIKGFHHGDAIEIVGALSDFHAAHGTGSVSLSFMNGGHLDSLTLLGSYSASHFSESGGLIKYT